MIFMMAHYNRLPFGREHRPRRRLGRSGLPSLEESRPLPLTRMGRPQNAHKATFVFSHLLGQSRIHPIPLGASSTCIGSAANRAWGGLPAPVLAGCSSGFALLDRSEPPHSELRSCSAPACDRLCTLGSTLLIAIKTRSTPIWGRHVISTYINMLYSYMTYSYATRERSLC